MRAVRKELLLLRAEVERSEFAQARLELHRKFANLSWLKLLVPGFGLGRARPKTTGRGVNATLTDLVLNHPLVSSLASVVLAKPLRATVAAGAKGHLGGASAQSSAARRADHRDPIEPSGITIQAQPLAAIAGKAERSGWSA